MKEFAWLQNHPLLASTEAVFQRGAAYGPRKTATINTLDWRRGAADLSGLTPPDRLSEAAHTLLTNIPYDVAAAAIRGAADGRKSSLRELKELRRLSIAARDVTILTTDGRLPDGYRALSQACLHMGRVLDTKGKHGVNKSIGAVSSLQEQLPTPGPLKTQGGLQNEVNLRLQSAAPLLDGETLGLEAEAIHTARKDHRRVAGLVVLSVTGLGLEWSGFTELAADGAALNRKYGQIKDYAIDGTQGYWSDHEPTSVWEASEFNGLAASSSTRQA